MEENIFFNERGVAVTDARFINAPETFAMSNVSSVAVYEEHPKLFGPIATIIIGVLLCYFGRESLQAIAVVRFGTSQVGSEI